MEVKKQINVIIPVYNSEEFIEKSVDSLLKQTYENWHAVIVDDGSTDNSKEKCIEICNKYPDRFDFYSIEHGGPGKARNFAMDKSSKDAGYWFFMDSDDYIDPDMFEKLTERIIKDDSQMSVCGYVRHMDARFKNISYRNCGVIGPKEVFESLLEDDEIGSFSCNKMFLYSTMENLRYPEGCFYEDILLFYKVVSRCERISVIEDNLYHYVWHKTSVVASKSEKQLRDFKNAAKERSKFLYGKYPDLRDKLILNYMNVDIYIYNRVCKSIGTLALNKASDELEFIRDNTQIYSKLNKKYNVMAHLIKLCPKLYAKMMYLLRDFFLLN